MRLARDTMIDRMLARDPAYDGRFVTGVLSTGIYCIPSCPAKNPKPENVRFFSSVEAARDAGLRACKRCRPDDFYRRYDPDLERIEALAASIRADPARFGGVDDLAAAAGHGSTKLHDLFRQHFHTTPARFLARARVDEAASRLLATRDTVTAIAFDVGFESLSAFHENFRRAMALGPSDYRRLLDGGPFVLALPERFRGEETLRHLGRNAESVSERVRRESYRAALCGPQGRPVVIDLALRDGLAEVALIAPADPRPAEVAVAHRAALSRLGLVLDPEPLERLAETERDVRRLVSRRPGLRLPLLADPFEGLCWVVIGQQIGLAFAYRLMNRLVERCGRPAKAGLLAPPGAAEIAALEPSELEAMQFSRRKAEYLVGAARQVVDGELDLDGLGEGSATAAERRLLEVRGIGPWSAHYLLMRAYGFADALPLGDAGLVRALVRFFALDRRPDRDETLRLMERFRPHRSLATYHLWTLLTED